MLILHLVWHKKDCFVKAKSARFLNWYYFHKLFTIFESYFILFTTDYSILALNGLNILHTVSILKIDAAFNT